MEVYPVSHATTWNTLLGPERQALRRNDTKKRIVRHWDSFLKQHYRHLGHTECGTEWVQHIPCHEPASKETKEYNALLNTTLRAVGGGTFKHWDTHLGKATSLVNSRASANPAGPAQTKLLCTVEGSRIAVLHIKICWEKQSGLFLPQAKANLSMGLLLFKDLCALGG